MSKKENKNHATIDTMPDLKEIATMKNEKSLEAILYLARIAQAYKQPLQLHA